VFDEFSTVYFTATSPQLCRTKALEAQEAILLEYGMTIVVITTLYFHERKES
jgi:hypothetical protein